MGPNYDRQPDFGMSTTLPELGRPVQDQDQSQQPGRTPESLGVSDKQPATTSPQTAAPMVPVNPVSQNDNSTPQTSIAPTTSSNPSVADDKDLIEKEWVDKAKKIIESTSADPYKQTREMSRFKADYLKKRYNKDIKVVED